MNTTYASTKALWHLDRLEVLRHGQAPQPVHVQLVLSDLCNQDCSFCAYRMSDGLSTELFAEGGERNPPRRMATDVARAIIDDCAMHGVKAIQFTGGGEPTVHAAHLELFDHAQAHGIDTGLVTNGIRLDPRHAAVLGLKWIRISIDAGTEESYCRTRNVAPSHWSKLWANIDELVAFYHGRLSVGFVVTNENVRELGEFIRLCAKHGVKSVRVGAVFTERGAGYYKRNYLQDAETVEELIAIQIREVRHLGVDVVNLFPRRIAELRTGPPKEPFCGYQYLTVYVGGDLGVYRCCNTAYTTRGKIGDLKTTTFGEWITARKFDGFDASGCHFCQFHGQNQAIDAAMREPNDANFV